MLQGLKLDYGCVESGKAYFDNSQCQPQMSAESALSFCIEGINLCHNLALQLKHLQLEVIVLVLSFQKDSPVITPFKVGH